MAALSVVVVAPVCRAMDYVVVRAENSDLAPGAVLKDGQSVTLASGAKITLVGETGKTFNLAGPFDGTLPAGQPAEDRGVVASLSRLMTMESRNRSLVGAYKGGGRGDPWSIQPGAAETFCVKGGHVQLHRDTPGGTEEAQLWSVGSDAPSAGGGMMAIGTETGNVTGRVRWENGQSEAAWPREVAMSDGGRYRMSWRGRTLDFMVAVAPREHGSAALAAAWMTEKGCVDQALILIGGVQ